MANNFMLFDEQPLVVDRVLAKYIGLNEAIVVQQLHYWLKINERSDVKGESRVDHFHDGRYWAFNTIQAWQENDFSFWSYDTVKRTFSKLTKLGIIVTGNYNDKKFDKTIWYSLDYAKLGDLIDAKKKELEIKAEGMPQSISANCPNGEVQNAPIDESKMHQSEDADCTDGKGQDASMEEGKMHQTIPEIPSETSSETPSENTTKIPSEKESLPLLSVSDTWEGTKQMLLQVGMTDIAIGSWIKPLLPVEIKDGIIKLKAENQLQKQFTETKFKPFIDRALSELGLNGFEVIVA